MMGSLVSFANVVLAHTPDLDTNFNALGALVNIPCTASGTNTIALTPFASLTLPTVSAYTDQAPVFSFFAAATSTGAITININGLGAKKLFKNNGQTLAGSNDLISGALYQVSFKQSLDGGSGGFIILNQVAMGAAAGSVPGKSRNTIMTGTADATVTVTADAIALWDGSLSFFTATSVNVSINAAVNGVNGLDTGALANNTWYAAYVIYNPGTATVAGLLSTNFSTPTTLPSGYTLYARAGAIVTNGAAKLHRILQKGNNAQYVVGATTTTAMPVIASGAAGTFSSTAPVWASASVATIVPPTAAAIRITACRAYNNAAASDVQVAPNNTYTGPNTTNPPWFSSVAATAFPPASSFEMGLESTNVFWTASAAGGAIVCGGFTDNL
jgi:hypothetical protein